MTHEHSSLGDRPARIPAARRPQREVGIRELRNAGKVVADLAGAGAGGAGAVGRVTSGGRLVGWLVPATPAERRADELEARGKLRRGRSGGLAGRRPLPAEVLASGAQVAVDTDILDRRRHAHRADDQDIRRYPSCVRRRVGSIRRGTRDLRPSIGHRRSRRRHDGGRACPPTLREEYTSTKYSPLSLVRDAEQTQQE